MKYFSCQAKGILNKKGVHDPFLERIRRGRIPNFSLEYTHYQKMDVTLGHMRIASRPAWLKVSQKSLNSFF